MQKHCWLHVWKQYYNKIIVLKDLNRHFSVLKKYMNNFDCLEHKMLTNFYLFSEIYKKNYSSRNNYGNTFSQKLINKL